MRSRFTYRTLCACLLLARAGAGLAQQTVEEAVQGFVAGYRQLDLAPFSYDYRETLAAVRPSAEIARQQQFLREQTLVLQQFDRNTLDPADQLLYDHLAYEVALNRTRLELEQQWAGTSREIPPGGLYTLPGHEAWYGYFVQKLTTVNLPAEDIMAYGMSETRRVQAEIGRLSREAGFTDSAAFVRWLNSDTFFIDDKEVLLQMFRERDRSIRERLGSFTGECDLPEVYPLEWPDAGPNTPPGMYLGREDNAYGADVFYINFYGQRYNRRAIDWLYIHEAIPGHHLQSRWGQHTDGDSLQPLFLYPGNFEGWACYVEYHGKELGVYNDLAAELGKWEWDLVRSVRLVLDVGIHYHGWSRERALEFWKANIPGQDDIAAREVTRVTNWPAQALGYKIGARIIGDMKAGLQEKYREAFDPVCFHRTYLDFGNVPLEVMRNHFETAYLQHAHIKP